MIGFLSGLVLFSDGQEVILQTPSGLGYQIYFHKVLVEGSTASVFISHIIREDSETLYGFSSLRAKKMFELLLSVKGIGPKSAYAMVATLSIDEIITAVKLESKNVLTKVPGLGSKGASQIILDLSNKIDKIKMYSDQTIRGHYVGNPGEFLKEELPLMEEVKTAATTASKTPEHAELINQHQIMQDTLLACKELGFKEDKIIPVAQKILAQNLIHRPEQLIHLVLKEI